MGASTGTTPIGTTDDTPVLVALTGDLEPQSHYILTIINEGAEGFYSTDNQSNWGRLTGGSSSSPGGVTLENQLGQIQIWIKREADGTNLSDIYVEMKDQV